MVGGYKVVTLCGSTKFKDQFMKAQKDLTLQKCIVISVGLFGHSGDSEVWENMSEDTMTQTKVMLDDMHKRKIDMADEIFVINVGDYIGESTKSEIAYAKAHGKRVNYLEPHAVMYEDPTGNEKGAALPWENAGSDLSHTEQSMHEIGASLSKGIFSPEDATANMLAFQQEPLEFPEMGDERRTRIDPHELGEDKSVLIFAEDENETDSYSNGTSGQERVGGQVPAQEQDADPEDDADAQKRLYALSMLRDGYDIGNTAYFIGTDEDYVRKVMKDAGITEADLARFQADDK